MADNSDICKNILGIPKNTYGEKYVEHVLEIYKLYVEMADRISSRRQATNSFFLTINSAIVAVVGYVNFSTEYDNAAFLFYTSVALAGMVLSYFWYRLVLSYKQLNSGKFKVVHVIESMLPVRPYDAEWTALGGGKNPKLYKPFTDIETAVPWVFFSIHTVVLLASMYFAYMSPA